MQVTCPKCRKRFDTTYSRAFACGNCQSATFGDCGLVRCPYCGNEFEKG